MLAAPLPLLGTFHEFSVTAAPLPPAVEFYQRLGFELAPTSDAFAHPYGALTDGRLCIGLHERGGASPVLTFVRAEVAQGVAALELAGLELTVCRTGSEVFHEIGFHAACGQAVAVLEARTYSPRPRPPAASLCGDFVEISLPAPDFALAQRCWETLGFVAADPEHTPYPRLPLTSDFLDLAFHPPRLCATAMVVFEASDLRAAQSRLESAGVSVEPLTGVPAGSVLRLTAPEGTALLLRSAQG